MSETRRAGLFACGLVLLAACGLPKGGLRDEAAGLDEDASLTGDAGGDGGGARSDATVGDGSVAPAEDAGGDANASADGALDDAALVADASALDAGTPDAGALDASRADAALDAASGADACTPQGNENCTNGVDDDCNGLVDCADPACGPQYECVPTIPSGWNSAALSIGSRGGCPSGFASQRDVVLDPTGGAASCTCNCSSSGTASCEKGSVTFYGPNLFGNDCSIIGSSATDVADGACRSNLPFGLFGFGIGANAPIRVSKIALTPNTCTGNVSANVPPAGTQEGKRCTAQTTTVGGGCSAGLVCARRVGGAYQSCVAKGGSDSCPSGWPTKHDTGTSVTDTRACSACTCGTTASCGPATVTFFSGNSCDGTAAVATANDSCNAIPTGGQGASSWRYDAAVLNPGCQKTGGGQATGSIAFANAETVCCR
jgi:hypothetical protein